MIDQMGDLTPLYGIFAVCSAFIVVLGIGYWVEKRATQRSPCKGTIAKFYTREMCKAAHALSRDDLEDQAQNLIKHINEEWRLKRTGGEDNEQGTRCL